MIRRRSYVPLNQNREELTEKGLELFNFVANDGEIHDYIAGRIPAHWHRELEIFLLLSGWVRISFGDHVADLNPGEGCLLNAGVLHSFLALTEEPCRFHSFVFDSSVISGAPGSIFDTRYVRPYLTGGAAFVFFTTDDTAFHDAFHAAFSACEAEETGYEFLVRSAVSRILLLAAARSHSARTLPAAPQQEQRLKELLGWIDAHLDRAVCVDDLARAAHVCPRECQRLFRRYLHCRPMEYLMQRRLLAAARLLADTDEPVTAIAMKFAFSSPSHFSRQFRLATGCTPTQYRARLRSQT